MAFLDDYSDAVRIELGRGYWIDIKPVLTYAEQRKAEKYLRAARAVVDPDGRMQTTVVPNFDAYRFTRLMAAIVGWNLDEKDGSIWALEPEDVKAQNINRLPASVADKVDKQIDELSKENPTERREFRDESVGGNQVGDDAGAGFAVEVPEGEVVVGELGDPGAAFG